MGKDKIKEKPKSFADQLAGLFTATKTAESKPAPEPEDEQTIAERINFGGRYPDKDKKPKPRR